jgi:hypothetical protein
VVSAVRVSLRADPRAPSLTRTPMLATLIAAGALLLASGRDWGLALLAAGMFPPLVFVNYVKAKDDAARD